VRIGAARTCVAEYYVDPPECKQEGGEQRILVHVVRKLYPRRSGTPRTVMRWRWASLGLGKAARREVRATAWTEPISTT